jgi:TatD DNase family protein
VLPKIIHFLLRFAVHDERDRFVEFEKWTAIERDKFLAFDFEFNRQHRSHRMTDYGCFFRVTESSPDFRVLKYGHVKVHGLLGLIIKPQEWSNFLHGIMSLQFGLQATGIWRLTETPYNVPMLIDTHAHLDFPDFENDLEDVLRRAEQADVERIITIGTSIQSSRRAIELAEMYPAVFAAIGVHPSHVEDAADDVITPLRELAQNPRVVAIGETGLDYHHLPSETVAKEEQVQVMTALRSETDEEIEAQIREGACKSKQASLFQQQLDLAVELGLNVVIHQRDAWGDTLEVLRPYTGKVRGVFHCFGGSLDEANQVLDLNHLVSFTGIITFKNAAAVRQVATEIPLWKFMVETDCPYLAPAPFRGKRCEPAYARIVAEAIAAARGASLKEIAEATTETADQFFRFNRA